MSTVDQPARTPEQVYADLSAARPGDMFAFRQPGGEYVGVVIARMSVTTPADTWQPAHPGDTPGQLVPGEEEETRPVDIATHVLVVHPRRWEMEHPNGCSNPAETCPVRVAAELDLADVKLPPGRYEVEASEEGRLQIYDRLDTELRRAERDRQAGIGDLVDASTSMEAQP